MKHTIAGRSLLVFGLLSIAGSIAAGMGLHGRFVIDLGGPLAGLLGLRVAKGNRTAAKWAIALMALYLGVALFLAWIGIMDWGLRIGGEPMRQDQLPWVLAGLLGIGVWAAINIALIVGWLFEPRP